jgi:hypothetical protein
MKIDDALQTFTHFFNDIIGTLIPGMVLGVGIVIIHKGLLTAMEMSSVTKNSYLIFLAVALSFAVGHAILGIHGVLIAPLLKRIGLATKLPKESIETSRSFILFKAYLSESTAGNSLWQTAPAVPDWNFSEIRNVAMSVAGEGASVGRRFMFISLLSNGVGTALWILALDFYLLSLVAPKLLIQSGYAWPPALQAIVLIGVGAMCFRHADEFHRRSLSAPFAIAVAALIAPKEGG